MGLPIKKLICASNENNIITDFINTGIFNLKDRKIKETCSPAIDILNPSNIERLCYFLTDFSSSNNSNKVGELFKELSKCGAYEIEESTRQLILNDFEAYWCQQDKCLMTIKSFYERTGVLLDPHTSVAKYVADNYVKDDKRRLLIAGTAHFGKFPETIINALGLKNTNNNLQECFEILDNLPSKPRISDTLKSVLTKPIIHKDLVEADINLIKSLILEKIKSNQI